MIAFVRGTVFEISENRVVLDTGSIGYEVFVPMTVLGQLSIGEEDVTLYTYMNVKEDEMSLYGFLSKDMLSMFKLLISVSGIGPKGALSILSLLSPDDIRFAILSSDAKTISRAQGIGAKTAARLIVELKDKVSVEDTFAFSDPVVSKSKGASPVSGGNSAKQEAVEALTALGYSGSEALKALKGVETNGMTTEEILKAALKNLSF